MQIVPDNDAIGAVRAIYRILESPDWSGFLEAISVTLTDFEELSLTPDASDREVWQRCQESEVVLLTGNRVGGKDSLTEVIAELADERSLPVITFADRARVLRDREYAETCAIALLELLENTESLRGTHRLFIP